jgi:hypothetical protein
VVCLDHRRWSRCWCARGPVCPARARVRRAQRLPQRLWRTGVVPRGTPPRALPGASAWASCALMSVPPVGEVGVRSAPGSEARSPLGPEGALVTTPSEIIPYYRLNHSIWSLSDNKESSHWVLLGLHPINHWSTQKGSNVCIKTPTKESPECLTN